MKSLRPIASVRRIPFGAVMRFAIAVLCGMLLVHAAADAPGGEAHTGHPQKKLFTGRWYQQPGGNYGAWMTLTTSQPYMACDGNAASCADKWFGPSMAALSDWNSQPTTVRFDIRADQNQAYDVQVYVGDVILGNTRIGGLAQHLDAAGNWCDPNACTYRYGNALLADDAHGGPYGTPDQRRTTVLHELGHLLSLRHESVNADESVRYACGQDNTGPIPHSVMAYNCIDPPAVGGAGEYYIHDWDVCGVNHAYPDPGVEWEGCVCYPPPVGGAAAPGTPAYYHPIAPARVLDTRDGTGGYRGRLGYGCKISVRVTGVGGVPAVSVSAVVFNATIAEPSRNSYLTVYPSDVGLPTASNVNFTAGQTVPNLVTGRVGSDGRVNVYNASGQTQVIFDVVGWYSNTPGDPPSAPSPTPTPEASGYGFYHPLPPQRIMDTRSGLGWGGKVGHNGNATVTVRGRGGVPASGVTAVALNTTVTEPTAGSYLTVYPSDATKPVASNLNFGPGQTVPNLVIVGVGADGKVNVYNAVGQVHVIFDVVGWYGGAGGGLLFHSLPPARIVDTRLGLGSGQLGHNRSAGISVTAVGGVPASAKGVVLNATVTEGTGASYITIWPSDATRPTASSLNFAPGQTVANLVMVKVPPNGSVNVYNAVGQVHLVWDVVGYFE